jgi:hypothetical protein
MVVPVSASTAASMAENRSMKNPPWQFLMRFREIARRLAPILMTQRSRSPDELKLCPAGFKPKALAARSLLGMTGSLLGITDRMLSEIRRGFAPRLRAFPDGLLKPVLRKPGSS